MIEEVLGLRWRLTATLGFIHGKTSKLAHTSAEEGNRLKHDGDPQRMLYDALVPVMFEYSQKLPLEVRKS